MNLLDKMTIHYGLDTLAIIEQEGNRSVSPAGVRKIQSIVGIPASEWPAPGFGNELVTRGGKYTVRLADWMVAWNYPKPTGTLLAEVGRVAESYASVADRIRFDLTDKIMAWPPGRFHFGTNVNAPSCLRRLPDYAGTVPELIALGAIALRLFRPGGKPGPTSFYGNLSGLGRSFLLPIEGSDHFAMVNLYGLGGDGSKHAGIIIEALAGAGIKAKFYRAPVRRDNDLYFNENADRNTGPFVICEEGDAHLGSVAWIPKKKWGSIECGCCKSIYRYPKRSKKPSFCPDCGNHCSNCDGWFVYAFLTWVGDQEKWLCSGCTDKNLSHNPCGSVTMGQCQCGECDG